MVFWIISMVIANKFGYFSKVIIGYWGKHVCITDWRIGRVFSVILKVFRPRTPPEAVDLACKLLDYTPNSRISPLQACSHAFFDELREPNGKLPNGRPFPPLFNFTQEGKYCIFSFVHPVHEMGFYLNNQKCKVGPKWIRWAKVYKTISKAQKIKVEHTCILLMMLSNWF